MEQKVTVEQQYAVGVAFIASMVQDTATLAHLLGDLTIEMKKAESPEDNSWLSALDWAITKSLEELLRKEYHSTLVVNVSSGHRTLYVNADIHEEKDVYTLFAYRMSWEDVMQKMLPSIMER